ncbi:ricin-type beta-trefoil lectin domain protein [Microbispora cellulosiformans]|uniref:Ricin-type beta-trefoil lectin domain protein n=1 Tax=Microbispora cellulosiformans TaxID=2614688 RepID=A0A5J5KAH7_9ACTN|nr:RICIN domain-containing protein [Microbispora cellulosiformans]KAA9381722.1 ricin-type beta-trefoil lectin domain protein [Microbispora cellulosiformans]
MRSITRSHLVGVLAVAPFLLGSGATAVNAATSASVSLARAAAPYAAAPPIRIQNRRSGLCMEVNQGDGTYGLGNGTGIVQYTCHTGTQQQWTLFAEVLDGAGNVLYVSFVNGRSGKCLEPNQADGTSGLGNGTGIVQYTCHHGVQQHWRQIAMGDGYFLFQNRRSGLCMEVNQGDGTYGLGNGTGVLQYTCHGGAQQQWRAA